MINVSDQHGRAFEYIIAKTMQTKCHAVFSTQTLTAQHRDEDKFHLLPCDLSQVFYEASVCLVSILRTRGYQLDGCNLERLPDSAAEAGDVTDIRISLLDGRTINLSIKNNHHALKHQRPPSLMQQLGFGKNSNQDLEYRRGLLSIYADFHKEAKKLVPAAVNFRDLDRISSGFIADTLYRPVCAYVARALTAYMDIESCCHTFFTFLVGNTDYTKVILSRGRLEIEEYNAIQKPRRCCVSFESTRPNYVFLDFDNNWRLSLRLHTAASAISDTPSLKFDTQAISTPVPSQSFPLRG